MGRSIKATQTDVLLFLIRMYPKKSHSTKINVSVDAILYDNRQINPHSNATGNNAYMETILPFPNLRKTGQSENPVGMLC